tara:strand:+ start:106 stop:954 length:849 start_codon:yes stop_codon:yes gene_type:complete
MPELPEAECVVRCLRGRILGSIIVSIWVGRRDIVRHGIDSLNWYIGAKVEEVKRKGKCVVFTMWRDGSSRYIVVELGLSGLLLFCRAPQPFPQHTHFVLKLDGSEPEIRYWNSRRFGRVHLYDCLEVNRFLDSRYGPDPLSLSFGLFASILRGRKSRLKALLMHQKVIAGIGNIYANEILFDARLHPECPANQLNTNQQRRLFVSMNKVLRGAIEEGGSSIQSFKIPSGERGMFQKHHLVYGKEGFACPSGCGSTIRRFTVERSSFVCVKCQRLPRRRCKET